MSKKSAAAASSPSSATAAECEAVIKIQVKNASKSIGKGNFRWELRANRIALAACLKRCLANGVTKGVDMFETFQKSVSAGGEEPPGSQATFTKNAKEMSTKCLLYYYARNKEKHNGQTTTQQFNVHLPENLALQLADCLNYFKGTETATELSNEALDVFYMYGMNINTQSALVEKHSAALAENKKRLDEQAAEGLQAATGKSPKRMRMSPSPSSKYDQVDDELDDEEDDFEDNVQCSIEERFQDDVSTFSASPSISSGGKRERRIQMPSVTTQLAEATESIRFRLRDSMDNVQATKDIELAKLKLEEKKFEMEMEEKRKDREERIKAQEQDRKERIKAQEQDRLERLENQRLQQEMMQAFIAALKKN